MRIAIISDIHANLEALTVCLNKIRELNADKIICLGDLVDYCADPNECVQLIRKNCDVVVLGNHDEAQFNYDLVEGFNKDAMISSIHTRSVIKPEHVEYFKTLPYSYSYNNLLFLHASPLKPQSYKYVLDSNSANINFNAFNERICFIGHSHIPVIYRYVNENVEVVSEQQVSHESKYIINVGSVGQPRDGDPRLSFGFFDTEEWTYQNIRCEYDWSITSNKIRNERLPIKLAIRILEGI